MPERYRRSEDALADLIRENRRGTRDAQRATGTEKAQTAATVLEMGSAVTDALEQAQQAIEDAADALTTSSGKNSRRRGQTEPPPPPGGWVQGDQWVVDNADGVPVEVRVWDGVGFVPEQLLAAELLVLSGGLIRLADGVVTADAIAADAIDGMTITGAEIIAYAGGNAARAILKNGALTFDFVGSPGAGTMTLGPGGIDSNDSNARFKIRKQSSAPGVGLDIVAGSGGSNTASILMDGASGGKIKLNAAAVEFQGDRSWARIDSTTYGPVIGHLGSGVTHLVGAPYDGLRARIKGGVLYITGAIQRTGGFPKNYVLFTLNNPYRAAAAAVQYAYSGGHNFILASQIDGTVVVAVASSNPLMYLGLTIPLD